MQFDPDLHRYHRPSNVMQGAQHEKPKKNPPHTHAHAHERTIRQGHRTLDMGGLGLCSAASDVGEGDF